MLIPVLLILAGLVILTVGADFLVRGGASVAMRMGVTPLVIGLTVVAFGTGSPEFVVSIQAALDGNSGIALGNIVGSNISNVALILGCAALVRPLKVQAALLRKELPILVAITGFLWLLVYDGTISRLEGGLLLTGGIGYTVFTYVQSRRKEKKKVEKEFAEAVGKPGKAVWIDVLLIVLGLGALVGGAQLLLSGGVTVAQAFGMSDVAIGLTIIAVGTSLPELATSVVAAYRGEPDIAFGNAIGSNILNILAVLGLTALISPFSTEGIRSFDLGAMLGSVIILYVLMGRRFILDRVEGALLVAGYVVYVNNVLASSAAQ